MIVLSSLKLALFQTKKLIYYFSYLSGYQDETLTAFQQYTDEMRNKHQKNNA